MNTYNFIYIYFYQLTSMSLLALTSSYIVCFDLSKVDNTSLCNEVRSSRAFDLLVHSFRQISIIYIYILYYLYLNFISYKLNIYYIYCILYI